MEKNNKTWEKVFLGFGVITVISGIFLFIQKDYLIGISGSIVGIGLVLQNIKKIKE